MFCGAEILHLQCGELPGDSMPRSGRLFPIRKFLLAVAHLSGFHREFLLATILATIVRVLRRRWGGPERLDFCGGFLCLNIRT